MRAKDKYGRLICITEMEETQDRLDSSFQFSQSTPVSSVVQTNFITSSSLSLPANAGSNGIAAKCLISEAESVQPYHEPHLLFSMTNEVYTNAYLIPRCKSSLDIILIILLSIDFDISVWRVLFISDFTCWNTSWWVKSTEPQSGLRLVSAKWHSRVLAPSPNGRPNRPLLVNQFFYIKTYRLPLLQDTAPDMRRQGDICVMTRQLGGA